MACPRFKPFLRALLAAAGVLTFLAGDAMALDPSSPSSHCLGRFDFALPSRLAPTGREQHIYLVKAWVDGGDAGGDGGWNRRVADIERTAAGPARKLSLANLGPALWYPPSAQYPDDRRLLFMRSQGGTALFLEATASTGREPVAEQVVARIAASYQPGSASGFCLGGGALVIAPSRNERAHASFGGGGLEVELSTETVAAPDEGAATRGGTHGIPVLAQAQRNVAGLPGVEEKVSVPAEAGGQGGRLLYTWVYPGQAGDGLHPRIRLKAAAGEGSRTALDAAWALLTQSLRLRPAGVR